MENSMKADLDYIIDNTGELWEELRGKRLFITGGTGFIGIWLLESFTWANERLGLNAAAVVLTRSPESFAKKVPHLASHPALRFHRGDVRDFSFPDGEFSHIIHAAKGVDAKDPENPLLLFNGIVDGTRRVAELAANCHAKKVLFTSSGAVYGQQPSGLSYIDEDYPGAPLTTMTSSAYGEGKRAAEFLFAASAGLYGFEAKIARCFAFVGPHLPLDINFAIGNFIRNVLNKEKILIRGDGTSFRSYLYAADMAVWLWTILFRGASCRPYNVGSDREFAIAEIAGTVSDISQTGLPVYIAGKPSPDKLPERYVPSVSRALQELNLKNNIDLREAIRRTISWYLNRMQC